MVSRAGQNLYYFDSLSSDQIYQLPLKIPKQIFIDGYPETIETVGHLLRKTRMDHGIEAKQLQDILHADENSINGWECRGVYPSSDYLRRVVEFIDANKTEPIPRKTIMALCFANNPSYPKRPKNLGERLRATRMENFMSIKELARKLDVNECTVAKWELGKCKQLTIPLESLTIVAFKDNARM